MKLLIFVGFWAVLSGPARAEETEYEAPSCETLNALWPRYHAHFKLQFPRADHFECPSDTSRLAETFHALETVRFRPNDFGYAPEFFRWMGRTIKRFIYSAEEGAPAEANRPARGDVMIHPSFFRFPLYHRAAMLVHETRHVELGDSHVTCDHGDDKGKEACDARFSVDWSTGAYSHGWTYMLWLAKLSNYPAAERAAILSLLDWEVATRFNDLTDERIRKIREDYRLR